MEQLISLIIDVISALMGRSKEEKERQPPPANRPDPSRPRPQPRPSSWEDELRRLLENQNPPPSASQPPRTPPVMTPQVPRIITLTPQPSSDDAPPVYPARPRPVLISSPAVSVAGDQFVPLAASQAAYARASQLDKTAAGRIEHVPGQHVQLTAVVRQESSPEVVQVIALFKDPRATRLAVMAAVILGPPRAFEEHTFSNL